MFAKILLPLLAAASFAVASPIEQARDASPVAAAAAATSSTPAKGSFEYITYFASTECEFTSSTSNINANVCTNIGDGEIPGESFAFAFASGQSSSSAFRNIQLFLARPERITTGTMTEKTGGLLPARGDGATNIHIVTTTQPVAIAPAINGNSSKAQDVPASAMPYACVTCTRRKVRCDKTGPPCSTCRKTRLECSYEAPPPRKRKRKPTDDIHERLEHYESLLRQHGIMDPDRSPLDQAEKPSPSDNVPLKKSSLSGGVLGGSDPAGSSRTGKLLAGRGKSRYIDSTLWRNLEDLRASSDEEDDGDAAAQRGPAYLVRSPADPLTASMFMSSTTDHSLLDLHPTYDTAMKHWKIYLSHVEPLTKFFHVPTATTMVQRAAANPSTASKSMECLLFAIYHFASVAMTDEECQRNVGEDRAMLQHQYHGAVTQAFLNVSFLRTTDIIVVQAFVMFLLSVRNKYDPHTFWILTGVGVRLAQRIGLHRDGEDLGVAPFEVQMRRRLFWQLLPLDGIAAQVSGTGIALPYDSWDTKQPLNLNDEDIFPGMTETPAERIGATDMLFCLLRTEMGKFHQKVKPFLGNMGHLCEAGDLSAVGEMEAAIVEMGKSGVASIETEIGS
ncbi:hypothetical protein LTS10_012692 [Elasticomyces elasticus]|nr:hypothetical protein LTS10_012692 [Elasticomyces elasticus]